MDDRTNAAKLSPYVQPAAQVNSAKRSRSEMNARNVVEKVHNASSGPGHLEQLTAHYCHHGVT